jgi:ribonuclease BN (tRNA processing enzyme)
MKLTILGSGDAFGSGGGFNTCFLLDSSAKRILVDCGASSMAAIRKFGIDPATIDAVLVTHLHAIISSAYRSSCSTRNSSPRARGR